MGTMKCFLFAFSPLQQRSIYEIRHQMMSSPATSPQKKVQYQKMCRPKNWRAEVHSIKQPCWCGEEWQDHHEDGNHGPVWVKVEE